MAQHRSSKSSAAEPTAVSGATTKQLVRLKLLVFVAGAVLMGLEIAGSRVLAPHFGNSVFVWGSLITVFLAAISIGNYVGGQLADRNPSPPLLATVCIGVSLWIIGISFCAAAVCEALRKVDTGSEMWPLIASLVLFLPPSVGMGVVSPFAIRLQASSLRSVGSISGSLYALSTLGSIAGTMATTFGLIPFFGIVLILRGLGLVLLLLSVLLFFSPKTTSGMATITTSLLIACLVLFSPVKSSQALAAGEVLQLDVSTPYHDIAVVDNDYYGARELRFDRYTESAISLRPPYRSLARYTDYFHLAFLVKPAIDRSLFIGAGGGIGPRTFHAHRGEMAIDVVDIDPKVLQIAQSHFFLEPNPQLRLFAMDGRLFVRQSGNKYDCIVLDAFTIGGRIPFHLVTQDFFALCQQRMTDDGVFVININSALAGPNSEIFASMEKTLQSVFPEVYVFVKDYEASHKERSTNIILVATSKQSRISAEEWKTAAAAYQSASYIDQPTMTKLVGDLVVDVPEVHAAIFSDDYAPIETMSF